MRLYVCAHGPPNAHNKTGAHYRVDYHSAISFQRPAVIQMASMDSAWRENSEELLRATELPFTDSDKALILKRIRESGKGQMEILITGRSGAGKSMLVNALTGKTIAKVGNKLRAETKRVISYKIPMDKEGVEVLVWVSPGLQDNEEQYLAELKEKCSNVDIVIYCISLTATRSEVGDDEMIKNDLTTIRKLTNTFSTDLWEHSVFVLTFANALEAILRVKFANPEKKFNERLQDWKKRIHSALLAVGVSKQVAEMVPVKPAGHPKKQNIPGQKYWVKKLWGTIAKRATVDILESESDNEEISKRIKCRRLTLTGERSRVIGVATFIGIGIGALIGLVGGIEGAVLGLIVGGVIGWLLATFFTSNKPENAQLLR